MDPFAQPLFDFNEAFKVASWLFDITGMKPVLILLFAIVLICLLMIIIGLVIVSPLGILGGLSRIRYIGRTIPATPMGSVAPLGYPIGSVAPLRNPIGSVARLRNPIGSVAPLRRPVEYSSSYADESFLNDYAEYTGE